MIYEPACSFRLSLLSQRNRERVIEDVKEKLSRKNCHLFSLVVIKLRVGC